MNKKNNLNGWIVLDKPAGITSTHALNQLKRALNIKKCGHAGTLDPLATGCLPIACGEATKTIQYLQDSLKTYTFTVKWGELSDTGDADGQIIETSPARPSEVDIKAALLQFIGTIMQTPPIYSAIKVDGKRAYDLARAGEKPELEPREITIETLELLEAGVNEATLKATCGKGTYIRVLAEDLAKALGTLGHITMLRRNAVGPFGEGEMILLEKSLEMGDSPDLNEFLKPIGAALDDIPGLQITAQELSKLKQGQGVELVSKPDIARLEAANLFQPGNAALARALINDNCKGLIEVEGPKLKPVKLFNF